MYRWEWLLAGGQHMSEPAGRYTPSHLVASFIVVVIVMTAVPRDGCPAGSSIFVFLGWVVETSLLVVGVVEWKQGNTFG